METSIDIKPFAPLDTLLITSLTQLRKLGEQDECIHAWDGDECMLCDMRVEF